LGRSGSRRPTNTAGGDWIKDWVRNEIIHALNCQKTIIPVLVAGAEMPPRDGLPHDLHGLLTHQAILLRDEKWDIDLNELIRVLRSEHGLVDNQKPVVMPQPEVKIKPLNDHELDDALSLLPDWQPVESMVPGDYPSSRQELRKAYRFQSFKSAIQFMNAAVDPINKMQHHPRWENQWRTVTVYLSTWDIDNKISKLDVELAQILDALYKDFRAKLRRTQTTSRQ
jgi:pterin-4a-carbinolamine dehydratase